MLISLHNLLFIPIITISHTEKKESCYGYNTSAWKQYCHVYTERPINLRYNPISLATLPNHIHP